MSTPAELYVNGIKKKLKHYFAAWLPNEPLKLGDVGMLDGAFFRRITSLNDIGISFQEREDLNPTPISYISESGVEIVLKAAGETNSELPNVPIAKAGIGFKFGHKGAFIVKAEQSFEPSIENINNVQREIIKAFKNDKWEEKWAVIIKIVKTPTTSILISNSSNAKVEISIEGDASNSQLDLLGANIELKVAHQTDDILTFLSAKKITPFFQLARLKSKLFNPVGVKLERNYKKTTYLTKMQLDNPEIANSLSLETILDSDIELN